MTLLNVCSLINNVNSPAEEAGDMHDDDLVGKRKLPLVLDGFSLEAMLTIFQLQKICRSRAFQHWEVSEPKGWLEHHCPAGLSLVCNLDPDAIIAGRLKILESHKP